MPAPSSLRPSPRVTGVCLVLGSLAFVAGWVLAVIAAPDLVTFFYAPRVLAITHTFTLGWISLTMIGVLYQYVPALTKRRVASSRGAAVQVALFALGTFGLITHFWIGHLLGMAWAAGLIAVSAVLFAAQQLRALLRAPQFEATVVGLIGALLSFTGTAVLGLLYAIDKVYPFLGGNVLSNIAGHAHLGLLGWVSLTICAVSYRMVAAFLLPTVLFPGHTRRQIVALMCVVPALLASLLLRSPLTRVAAVLTAVVMGWYAVNLFRLMRTRRMPLDWTLCHVLASLTHLAAALGVGLALLFAVDPGSALGSRLVVVYAVFLLGGWISNYIVGVGSRMAPGLMGRGAPVLLPEVWRAVLFGLLNGGIIAVAATLVWGSATALRAALLLPLGAALLFSSALLRRLTRLKG